MLPKLFIFPKAAEFLTSGHSRVAALVAAASCLLSCGSRPVAPPPFPGRYVTNGDSLRYWIDIRPDGTFTFWGATRRSVDGGHRGTWRPSSPGCITLESPPRPNRCNATTPEDSPDIICCIDPSACPQIGPFEICRNDDAALNKMAGEAAQSIFKLVPKDPADDRHRDTMTRYDPAVAHHLEKSCSRNSDMTHCHCALERDVASLDAKTLTGHLRIDAAEPAKLQHLLGSRLEGLAIYDPSLTSLDDLPSISTLKTLFVQAPLRRLPDMTRFPALESLILDRTHLTDFQPLEKSHITKLEVTSYQPISGNAFGKIPHLKWLSVDCGPGSSRPDFTELNQSRPDIEILSQRHKKTDRWPYLCGLLTPPSMQPCGWLDECFVNGLCSTNALGQCFAATDEDCQQSTLCLEKKQCSAQNGICVVGGAAVGGN